MSLIDMIVSGVAGIVAIAFLVAGSVGTTSSRPAPVDAGCAHVVIQELIRQKSQLRELATQSQRARTLVQEVLVEEEYDGD